MPTAALSANAAMTLKSRDVRGTPGAFHESGSVSGGLSAALLEVIYSSTTATPGHSLWVNRAHPPTAFGFCHKNYLIKGIKAVQESRFETFPANFVVTTPSQHVMHAPRACLKAELAHVIEGRDLSPSRGTETCDKIAPKPRAIPRTASDE